MADIFERLQQERREVTVTLCDGRQLKGTITGSGSDYFTITGEPGTAHLSRRAWIQVLEGPLPTVEDATTECVYCGHTRAAHGKEPPSRCTRCACPEFTLDEQRRMTPRQRYELGLTDEDPNAH